MTTCVPLPSSSEISVESTDDLLRIIVPPQKPQPRDLASTTLYVVALLVMAVISYVVLWVCMQAFGLPMRPGVAIPTVFLMVVVVATFGGSIKSTPRDSAMFLISRSEFRVTTRNGGRSKTYEFPLFDIENVRLESTFGGLQWQHYLLQLWILPRTDSPVRLLTGRSPVELNWLCHTIREQLGLPTLREQRAQWLAEQSAEQVLPALPAAEVIEYAHARTRKAMQFHYYPERLSVFFSPGKFLAQRGSIDLTADELRIQSGAKEHCFAADDIVAFSISGAADDYPPGLTIVTISGRFMTIPFPAEGASQIVKVLNEALDLAH